LFPIASLFPILPQVKSDDLGAAATSDPPAYAKPMGALPRKIVGFEPQAGECEKLNRLNGSEHIFLPHGIGDGSPRTFYECSSPYCSSLFEPDIALGDKFHNLGDLLRLVGTHQIQTRRLDDFAETTGTDFLKVDVLGGELRVLQGAVERLRTILAVHIEVEFLPLYKN
jgi:FkbM family methyltransferase